jgi:lysozyme
VIAFQKANGLVADGIYGAKSMAKLEEVLKKKSPSDQCIEIIKSFEGYSSVPYKDPIGVWTIGYGTTVIDGVKVSKNTPQITEARATMLLKAHVAGVASDLEKSTDCSKLTQHQFDALVSFVYNVGIGNFNKSSLRKNLPDKVTKRNFTDWNKADGKVLPGLVRRREEEYSLFTKPIV